MECAISESGPAYGVGPLSSRGPGARRGNCAGILRVENGGRFFAYLW